MDVYEAVRSRRAVRAFTDQPVPAGVLERVLSTATLAPSGSNLQPWRVYVLTAAGWSPSGGNLQPWRVYVMTGEPLARLKKIAVARVAAGDPWDEREFPLYPDDLRSPYRDRRSRFGKERYTALGIAREDWEARQRAAIGNWNCFGAPAALFCFIDRDMGLPQWADLGMYLQTVMLLLRTCDHAICGQLCSPSARSSSMTFCRNMPASDHWGEPRLRSR